MLLKACDLSFLKIILNSKNITSLLTPWRSNGLDHESDWGKLEMIRKLLNNTIHLHHLIYCSMRFDLWSKLVIFWSTLKNLKSKLRCLHIQINKILCQQSNEIMITRRSNLFYLNMTCEGERDDG